MHSPWPGFAAYAPAAHSMQESLQKAQAKEMEAVKRELDVQLDAMRVEYEKRLARRKANASA